MGLMPIETVRRRLGACVLAVFAASTVVVFGEGTAYAAERSPTCAFLDAWDLPPTTTSLGAAFGTDLAAGEVLEVSVMGTTDGNTLTLEVGPVGNRHTVLRAVAVDGQASVSYTASGLGGENNFFVWQRGVNLGSATLDLTCTPPPSDSDNDGVLDEVDRCPGTVLGSDVIARVPKHYGVDGSGAFVDGRGVASGFTIADTLGCSTRQIASTFDLPAGLARVLVRLGMPEFLLLDIADTGEFQGA